MGLNDLRWRPLLTSVNPSKVDDQIGYGRNGCFTYGPSSSFQRPKAFLFSIWRYTVPLKAWLLHVTRFKETLTRPWTEFTKEIVISHCHCLCMGEAEFVHHLFLHCMVVSKLWNRLLLVPTWIGVWCAGGAMNRWIISFFIAHCYGTLSKAVSGSGLSWVVSRGFNAFVIHWRSSHLPVKPDVMEKFLHSVSWKLWLERN